MTQNLVNRNKVPKKEMHYYFQPGPIPKTSHASSKFWHDLFDTLKSNAEMQKH